MRYTLETPELIQTRESMGLVKGIYDPTTSIHEPPNAYNTMLELIHRDPTLATAFSIVVDFVTVRGFDFIGGTRPERDKLRNKFLDLQFQEKSRNLVYTLLYYGDAFLELRNNNSNIITPDELWVLETTEMRIAHDIHGEIEGYVQRQFDMTGLEEDEIRKLEGTPEEPNQGVFFPPEKVIHFRLKTIGSQVYSYNPLEPIAQVAATKLHAGSYLMNIFRNMPPRYVAHLAGISKKDHVEAKREFQSTKTNYSKTIAFSRSSDPASKLQMQKVDAPYDKELIEIIEWLNSEMLKVTRVPRTWVEKAGTENRGIGENINQPFEVYIQSIHRSILEPIINRRLVPAVLGKEDTKDKKGDKQKVSIRYNEVTRKGEKEILMNAGLLRDMGLKQEALVKYLDKNGILGLDPEDFEEEQVAKNIDLNPSRARENKSTDKMADKLDSTGVSKNGAKKMVGAQA